MSRRNSFLGPLIGYHGCDHEVAEQILAGKATLKPSKNDYDWLGPGIYFWADSEERGRQWAVEQSLREGAKIKKPAVIGAFINPGHCLNLTDFGVTESLVRAHEVLKVAMEATATPMPANSSKQNGIFMRRQLDCSTINTLHAMKEAYGEPAYDTVYGVFEEGDLLFEGSGFRAKTHVQIAVINTDCIIGYFRVKS